MGNKLPLHIIKLIILLLLINLLLSSCDWKTHQPERNEKLNIYLFWGDGCPSCELAKPALESIEEKNGSVVLHAFEVNIDTRNRDLLLLFSDAYGIVPQRVPTVFIADQSWVGYSVNVHREIDAIINKCLTEPCYDLGKSLLPD